eukprot:753289-Hanusia_phi.AAC.2
MTCIQGLTVVLAGLMLSDWHICVSCKKSNRVPSSTYIPTASRRINAVSSRNNVAQNSLGEVSEIVRPIHTGDRSDQTDHLSTTLEVRSRARIPAESFLEDVAAIISTTNESKHFDEECKSSPCTPEGGVTGESPVQVKAALHDSDSASNVNTTYDHVLNSVGVESIRRYLSFLLEIKFTDSDDA